MLCRLRRKSSKVFLCTRTVCFFCMRSFGLYAAVSSLPCVVLFVPFLCCSFCLCCASVSLSLSCVDFTLFDKRVVNCTFVAVLHVFHQLQSTSFRLFLSNIHCCTPNSSTANAAFVVRMVCPEAGWRFRSTRTRSVASFVL
jgi:hypothetical protein